MIRRTKSRVGGAALLGALLVLLAAGCAPPTNSYAAVYVKGLSGATDVAAGWSHSCAVVAGGTVKCWGANSVGQLGNGTTGADSPTPVDVTGISGATGIAAAEEHTCVMVSGGAVKCWGANNSGQLGNGTVGGGSSTPVDVTGVSGATAVTAGVGHSCALVSGGAVKCWGSNAYGELGNGTAGGSSPTPVDVTGLSGAIQIDAGSAATCALVAGGAMKCWGSNGVGQLGDGTTTASSTPVDVVGVSGVTHITTSVYATTCAVVAGGAVKCWGSNEVGQLGDGNLTQAPNPTPVDVIGLTGATRIDAGSGTTCALLAGGAVKCWGSNIYGSLGTWTPTYYSGTPVGVSGVAGATRLASGSWHSCAVVAGGAVKCWGANTAGQLGAGV